MANIVKHKRGSGNDPSASDLVLGELAIRTDNGKLFTKMDSGAIAEIAGGGSDIAINTLSSSSSTGGGSATFNGSAYRFTLSSPPSVSAQQLLVSIAGVIQKPVAGSGQPSEGFSISGNDIILAQAPASGTDFFILTFRSLGVSEPADNTVTNAKVASNAAIAGSKINPNFGSQDITTTGSLTGNGLTINSTFPRIILNDSDHNSDFSLYNANGFFRIYDDTNNTSRLHVATDGTVEVTGNLDVGAGVDVTGNVIASGNVTAVDGTFSGNVSIGGTLTYEDVTNIDSVGIITARSSIKLDADGSSSSNFLSIGADDDLKIFHQSNVDKIESSANGFHIRQINNGDLHIHAGANTGSANNRLVARAGGKAELYYAGALKLSTETGGVNITGVCTATTFVGALTGTASGNATISSNADNRIITGGSGNALTGESELTYSTYLSIIRSNSDTNFGDNSAPGGVNGIFIGNSQSTNGVFSAITLAPNDTNGTNQAGSLIAKSVNGGYTPEVHIAQRTASNTNESNFKITSSREVELRYQGNTRLQTTSTGVTLSGGDHNANGTFEVNDGSSGDCFRALNGGSIKWCLGTTANTGNATVSMDARSYDTNKARLHKWTSPNRDGGSYGNYSESWYDGGAYRVITALTIGFAVDHHFLPGANNTYDLGTSSLRWRNIYTNDLNLSNEGGKNEVDGTWGNYTIQEGESDLFLINKRSGKKYKFNLTEVS